MPTIKHAEQPARAIIDSFGGCRPLARAIKATAEGGYKLDPSTISRWLRPAHMGGTGGLVPQKHWPILLRLAEKERKLKAIRTLLLSHASTDVKTSSQAE